MIGQIQNLKNNLNQFSLNLKPSPPLQTMLQKTILFVSFLFLGFSLFGQNLADTIGTKKTIFGGLNYVHKGELLMPAKILELTESVPEAHKLMKTANAYYITDLLLTGVGGGLIGFPIGLALAGADPMWGVVAVGAGLIVVSVPFSIMHAKKTKKAVLIYNDSLRNSGSFIPEINLGFSQNGLGLRVAF
jgi:hypothetical protein